MTTHTPAKATRCASPGAPRLASATNFLHHFQGRQPDPPCHDIDEPTGQAVVPCEVETPAHVLDAAIRCPLGGARRSSGGYLRGRLKHGRTLSEYRLSGLDYADGLLYAVSEPINTLFVTDPEHGLLRLLGIENGGPISAIAVRDGTAYLPLVHNWVDPRPPLLAVTLD